MVIKYDVLNLPNLMFCDIILPKPDGYKVLSQLRQDATTAAIPFVFITAKRIAAIAAWECL